MSAPKISAVVVAAGLSKRFSPHEKKQFAALGGKPLLTYCLSTFESSESITNVVVVVPEDEISRSRKLLESFKFEKITSVVAGGEKRHISVRNGFRATPPDSDIVLIHDAARPFINDDMIRRVIEGCARTGACICAVPVTDTLKRTQEPGPFVSETISREKLWRAQTPQVFRREILREIYCSDGIADIDATDESALVEAKGIEVNVVAGDYLNMKITTAADFKIAELILSKGEAMYRIGTGFDAHAFCEGRALILGGVEIPGCRGLAGHSDADVLSHAVADAILGAIGKGDLGKYFPPNDPKYKDASSLAILSQVAQMMTEKRYRIENIDCTVVCEEPRISPHSSAMEEKIADALGISSDAVNVKGTSTDGLGFPGRKEGIATIASACLSLDSAT